MMKIIASLGVCILVFVVFIITVAASRRELPVGLRDMYGDTSGIHRLTIEGEVTNFASNYGYTFHIGPDGDRIRMLVFNNSAALQAFHRPHWSIFLHAWPIFSFETGFVPVGPYEVVATESERTFFHDLSGNRVPATEYRIYGDVFAVETRFFGRPLYVYGQAETEHRLFMNTGRVTGYPNSDISR